LQTIREVLQKHGTQSNDFPSDKINVATAKQGRSASFDQYGVDSVLALTYHDAESFLALSLLYDDNGWETMPYQKDHVFPQAAFSTKSLKAAGLNDSQISNYQSLQNNLGNLNLILASENQGKSDEKFEKWLKTRDKSFRHKHLIPDNPALYSLDHFEEFVEAREKLIRTRLESIFGAPKAAD
jgi:hypothetical protein